MRWNSLDWATVDWTTADWTTADWTATDWAAALEVGRRERLLPLWFVTLRAAGRLGSVPPAARDQVQSAYYAALAANTLALEEAVRLTAQLAARGIDVVTLKGVALLATVYPARGVRPLGDIDLWVQPADAAQAEAVLCAAGYGGLEHQAVRGPQRFLAERTFQRRTPPPLQVDLHTAPFARPALNDAALAAWLWAHRQMAPTACGALWTFDAAAQFVHLALHATQHDEGRLAPLRLYDLAQVMADPHLEWAAVLAIAQTTRIAPALLQAMQATVAAWGVAPPPVAWPEAGARARLRCTLRGSERRAVRWLVDGWALRRHPARMVALWLAVLWPAPAYRAWRARIHGRALSCELRGARGVEGGSSRAAPGRGARGEEGGSSRAASDG